MLYRPLFASLEFYLPAQEPPLSDLDPAIFLPLLRDDTPLLDVRAPVEFQKGAFPAAYNIPLLNDEERTQVGTMYKQAGQDAAITLGHRLVSGHSKAQRLLAWEQWLHAHPGAWLYCFRGGLRSRTVQQWLGEAGIHCHRVPGGYKAMRQALIDTIEAAPQRHALVIVAGPTGSGKTHLLNALPNSLDLEAFAHHRGSAFGTQLGGQPTQINFENALAVRLLKLQTKHNTALFVEDESRAIGSLSVPHNLHTAMKSSPIALIEEDLEFRTQTIRNDYIGDNLDQFLKADPEQGFAQFSEYLLGSLAKIQRRLGGERYSAIRALMESALRAQLGQEGPAAHALWIRQLLIDYYDPMYTYQLSKSLERVVFRGSSSEFLEWAGQQIQDSA